MSAPPTPPDKLDLEAALNLHRQLADFLQRDWSERPVRPRMSAEEVAAAVGIRPGENGENPESLGQKLQTVLAMTPATGTDRFFNQLFGGLDPAAVLGEMLAPLLNNSMYTWKVAGPHVLIENELVAHMAAFAGMEGGDGIFTPGGSLSNMTAMIVARNEAQPGCREDGIGPRTMRVYSSAESHYSIRKSAGMVGIGRSNVVAVATDDDGCMRADALDEAIRQDLAAGRLPVLINATAGTTVQGAFDPIDAIADVAQKHGVWLHVDGAFGGSLLLSDRWRHKLAGLERADSFTWDAHKMMGVPLTCSVILTKRPGMLTRHLSESATYLYQGDGDVLNPGTRSIQCGRRNDLIKLWTAWQHHGDAGYEARIDKVMALAQHAIARIHREPALALSHRPQSVNVCFEVIGKSSSAVCDRLLDEGLAMVGTGDVNARRTIRLVCVDPAMTEANIDRFFDDVLKVSAALPAADNTTG